MGPLDPAVALHLGHEQPSLIGYLGRIAIQLAIFAAIAGLAWIGVRLASTVTAEW